jgi:hypothetical protein
MEQRLDATYLNKGPIERSAAVALAAAGIGLGLLFATWGISSLWRYAPPEIAVTISNPEVRIRPDGPLTITQDKPFTLAPPEPIRLGPGQISVKVEPPPTGDRLPQQTTAGEVIRREVTVFASVNHGSGTVVTGWNYKDGSGGMPSGQFCYYTSPNQDGSSRRVDLATDGAPRVQIRMSPVPDVAEALTKCQWWHAG